MLSVRDRRFGVAVLSVVVLAALAVLVATLTSGRGGSRPAAESPRARQFAAFTQCLLTDPAGLDSPAAAPLWAAMQEASSKTAAKSQYLALPAGVQPDEAKTYVNSLVVRGCDVILAADGTPGTVAGEAAADHPTRHFLLAGGAAPSGNTAVVRAGAGSAVVAKALTDAFNGRFPAGTVLR
ncbi:BMP family ABC transporter substrate-binding protein [Catenulispora yoronensis]